MTVAPCRAIRPSSTVGSCTASRGATTRCAPTTRGRNISSAAMSKAMVVTAMRQSPRSMMPCSRMPREEVGQAAVLDDDSLRQSRRTRGVDDVSGVSRTDRNGRRGGGSLPDRRRVFVEADDRCDVRRQTRAQGGLRDQHRHARIGEHVGETFRRMARIERQIGAARLEDAEEPDQHVERAIEKDPDHADRPRSRAPANDARAGSHGRRVPRTRGLRLLAYRSDGIGRPRRLLREQMRQQRRLHRRGRCCSNRSVSCVARRQPECRAGRSAGPASQPRLRTGEAGAPR